MIAFLVDPCDPSLSCNDGICHSSGISCLVTGTYGITCEEEPASPSSHAFPIENEKATITNWAIVALAIFCTFVTLIVVAFGWWHLAGVAGG